MSERDKIERAFLLGFLASREGFNGECMFAHLAPGIPTEEQIAEFTGDEGDEAFAEFKRLRGAAVERICHAPT